MKQKQLKLSVIALALTLAFTSCQKTNESLQNEKQVKNNQSIVNPPPPPSCLTYSSVSSTLLSSGWTQLTTLPTGFIPVFTGYNSVVAFVNGAGDYTFLYRYTDYGIAEQEKDECPNKWNPGEWKDGVLTNSGCYGAGKDCKVVQRDPNDLSKGINVICCD